MPSIALIGPDGAGKTTITRMLEQSGIARFKYIYMGVDIRASNVALFTSRLAERLKSSSLHGGTRVKGAPMAHGHGRGVRRRTLASSAWSAGRLINWLAEEWFRQAASWSYQLRGFTVLYDRHFVFDFAPGISGAGVETLDRRVHRWCLEHLYPRPELVIFLDAPGTVLFARKGESTAEELERRRQVFLAIGRTLPGFVAVDATRPLAEVYDEVVRHVQRLCTAVADDALAPEIVP